MRLPLQRSGIINPFTVRQKLLPPSPMSPSPFLHSHTHISHTHLTYDTYTDTPTHNHIRLDSCTHTHTHEDTDTYRHTCAHVHTEQHPLDEYVEMINSTRIHTNTLYGKYLLNGGSFMHIFA